MSFARLLRADAVAMVAALALLLVMAVDWYSTDLGQAARQEQKLSKSDQSNEASEAAGENAQDAKEVAQGQEKNAWQERRLVDRLVLLGLLATIILTIGAAWLRAAGRRFEPPWSPSALAAMAASVTAVLVVYRIVQKPGIDSVAVIKAGPPLALILLAVIVLAARDAIRREGDGSAWPERSKSNY